jgi:uncharacterized protein
VERTTAEGFARGVVTVEAPSGVRMSIAFQNENLVAFLDGAVVASVPDLICCLETAGEAPIVLPGWPPTRGTVSCAAVVHLPR